MIQAGQCPPLIQDHGPMGLVTDDPNQAEAAKQGEMALRLILASLTGKGVRLDKSV